MTEQIKIFTDVTLRYIGDENTYNGIKYLPWRFEFGVSGLQINKFIGIGCKTASHLSRRSCLGLVNCA